MAKNLMRIYNTETEYYNDIANLHGDTLSVIIENDKVNYSVKDTRVIINGGEEVHIFEDGIIPNYYFRGRGDIVEVEICSGINEIGAQAFYGCTTLEAIIIRGNLNFIGSNSISVSITIDYYGTTCVVGSFGRGVIPTINVTKDYECDMFCGTDVNIVL